MTCNGIQFKIFLLHLQLLFRNVCFFTVYSIYFGIYIYIFSYRINIKNNLYNLIKRDKVFKRAMWADKS